MSGTPAVKYTQQILDIENDGVVGPVTVKAINDYPDQKELHDRIWQRRKQHFENIVKNNPKTNIFLKG